MNAMRLDQYVVLNYPELSRTKVQKMIKDGKIRVNREPAKASQIVGESDEVYVKKMVVPDRVLKSEDIDLDILYEDKSCLVINKPAGMVVHPGEGELYLHGTVAHAVLKRVAADAGDKLRPGIVHRLDKDTSGALLIAKTKEAYDSFVLQFKGRKVGKDYVALVFGEPDSPKGVIDSPIGRSFRDRKKMAISGEGRSAISKYKLNKVLKLDDGTKLSLLDLKILTGRTHQIRVHMAAIGYPVVGDDIYGDKKSNKRFMATHVLKRQFLHAAKISFLSPATGKKVEVKAPLTDDLKLLLSSLQELS